MKRSTQTLSTVISAFALVLGLAACSDKPQEQAGKAADEVASGIAPAPNGEPTDVVARVGDQAITFSQINTMLNSSAVVGVSIPALGTPERDTVRIALLDKIVSANLLYLDALKQGVDQDPAYRQELQKFRSGILTGIYRDRYLMDTIEISDEEIQAYYQTTEKPDAELTDDVRAAIVAVLRKQKLEERSAELRTSLREGVTVQLNDNEMDPLQDAERADTAVLASIDGTPITWGEVRAVLGGKVSSASTDDRRRAMNNYIDQQILVNKASVQGLDKDPVFQARYNEYQKTRLINLHRGNLAREFEPTDDELQAYYEANRDEIMTPEFRKVQFVVVKTEEEASDLKNKIDAGEMTMYLAARDYSIDPQAKQNLGEIGWQSRGKGWPELDEVIFSLGPGEIGGPVETPAGWNLLLVQDVRDAQQDDFEQASTRKMTRRKYIHEKLDDYVVNLRKNDFPVEVYEENLILLAQQEADMVKQLAERAAESGSVTQQRLEQLQEIYK
jgi:peptidyl-prolyl cis-trans isomerase C